MGLIKGQNPVPKGGVASAEDVPDGLFLLRQERSTLAQILQQPPPRAPDVVPTQVTHQPAQNLGVFLIYLCARNFLE